MAALDSGKVAWSDLVWSMRKDVEGEAVENWKEGGFAVSAR